MSYRRNRNFGGSYGGNGPISGNSRMGMNAASPWGNQGGGGGNYGGGNMRQGGGGGGSGNMRQGGGGGGSGNMRQSGGGGQGMNTQAISLASNLLNNLFRTNSPGLLSIRRGDGGAGNRGTIGNNRAGVGNRNRRGQGGSNNRSGAKLGPNRQGGIRKQNAFERARKVLAKTPNNNKKKDSASGENTENLKKNKSQQPKESSYASVPNEMLYCHLCKKHMWDDQSFENHIKGRPHLAVRESVEEGYRLKANLIRQEAKIAQQLRTSELDRSKRLGRSKGRALEYCTMCDHNFHGNMMGHRKSEGHTQLKKFLHPRCTVCDKEFSTRVDYDTHLLSAAHMKKAALANCKPGEPEEELLPILTEEEELKDVRPPQKRKKKAAAAEAKKEGEEAEKKEGEEEEKKKEGEEEADEKKEGEEGAEEAKEEEEEVTIAPDTEETILDFHSGDAIPSDIESKLPRYNWTRGVATSFITKLECYACAICRKFFDSEKTVEVHSRTLYHHRQFVKFLNEKSTITKVTEKRATVAAEAAEKKKKAEETKNGAEKKADTEAKKENGDAAENNELYDPSEATGDNEDVEMAGDDEKGGDEEMVEEEENGDAGEDEEMDTKTEDAPTKDAPAAEEKPPAAAPTTPVQTTPQKVATPAVNTPSKTPAAGKAGTRGRGRGRARN